MGLGETVGVGLWVTVCVTEATGTGEGALAKGVAVTVEVAAIVSVGAKWAAVNDAVAACESFREQETINKSSEQTSKQKPLRFGIRSSGAPQSIDDPHHGSDETQQTVHMIPG